MFWFQLWREYKLSICEILLVFSKWKTVFLNKEFLILDNINKNLVLKKANRLWWTIKIVEINNLNILDYSKKIEWKFKYWISIFPNTQNLKKILIETKKELQSKNISSRFINKDFKNLNSAQIIWEKLITKWYDFSYIFNGKKKYVWYTIWVQNIWKYSERDWQKNRDMKTGMLPPKLCQIMINISWANVIYDPFVWLWTILIESIVMWNTEIYWSDLSEIMIKNTSDNINWFIKKNNLKINKYKIIKLNSKFIDESEILLNKNIDSIVTEWYLWEIMTKKNISLDRIEKQKKSLELLYTKFFQWLKKIKYLWNIVICFPFWEIKNKYIYFSEIYKILNQYCNINTLLPNNLSIKETNFWSLLYKRDKQLVWREIFKLTIK